MLLVKLIEKIPFFAPFSPEERQLIAETDSYFANYDNSDYLIRQGDEDTSLLILMEGKVVITKEGHPHKALATLEPGAIFGEMSFLTGRKRSSNVIALGKVRVFRIDGKMFAEMKPKLKVKIQGQLIDVLVSRLDRMNETLTSTLGEIFALQ